MNKLICLLPIALLLALLAGKTIAQTSADAKPSANKWPVFAEVGIGFGQTLMFGNTPDNLKDALGGEFTPTLGSNVIAGFFVAPDNWHGIGLGARIKGTFGSGVKGKNDQDDYIYNYYNLGFHAKYYPFSATFNRGLFVKGGLGFGQMTTKRSNEETNSFVHQYAIGQVLTASTGYTHWFGSMGLTLEAEFEYGSRNGTVNGKGDGVLFQSGQLGVNALVTF